MMKDNPKKKPSQNGDLEEMFAGFTKTLRDIQDQIDDIREKKDSDGGARKLIADNMYNTPRNRLREYSNISNSAVEPFSLAMTCAAVLNKDVLSGEKSLCEIFLENVLTFRRSVGGQLGRFAAEQAKQEAQKATEDIDAEEGRIKGL